MMRGLSGPEVNRARRNLPDVFPVGQMCWRARNAGCATLERTVETLTDRLAHDPHLGGLYATNC